jgi:flagellar biosynthesis protein
MEEERPKINPMTAIALRYDPENGDAPMVVAKGEGYVAAEIIKIAKENNVVLREDPALVSALSGLNIGSTIPPELYRVVAEVIAFVYRLQGKIK